MTRKQRVMEFCEAVDTAQFTLKSLCELFLQDNPDFGKGHFNHIFRHELNYPIIEENTTSKILGIPNMINSNKMELIIETVDVDKLDPNKFKAWRTGTAFDKIASKRNGIMPGTSYIVTGESGAGKTTICTNIAQYLKQNNEDLTAGFVSCEMDRDDWEEEVNDNPLLGPLETVFMLKYLEASNYYELLEEALSKWQFVILDSFEVVIDQLKEVMGWPAKKAESMLINLMRKVASENNSTIFAIQQYTKGGTFVGSNKIKHMLTGLIYVKFDKDGERYVYFDKNRRGGHMVGKALYFTKNKQTGLLEFNEKRFNNDEVVSEFSSKEKEKIQLESEDFDLILKEKQRLIEEKRNLVLGITNATQAQNVNEEAHV
jgi:predicted ATP-dependent serine protease